jgi:hypothetical protein
MTDANQKLRAFPRGDPRDASVAGSPMRESGICKHAVLQDWNSACEPVSKSNSEASRKLRSFPRKPESSIFRHVMLQAWTPACAGVSGARGTADFLTRSCAGVSGASGAVDFFTQRAGSA